MPQDIQAETEAFAKEYAALWSAPAMSLDEAPRVAQRVAQHYRPGFTFFTNGGIARFESQDEAARLIEAELRKVIASGLGAHMVSQAFRVEAYSASAAQCWITFAFRPRADSAFAGKDWTFTNVYGYRAATAGQAAGWEFVVRDQEVNEMRKATGTAFDE